MGAASLLRSTLVAALAVLALSGPAVATPADAETQLPVGESKGVRIVRERGAIVVIFTSTADRLWRRVAGRRVEVDCEELPDPDKLGSQVLQGGGTVLRAPRRGRRIRTGDLTKGMDYCSVALPGRRIRRRNAVRFQGRVELVRIPLTQRGANYLDERAKVRKILIVEFFLEEMIDRRGLTGYPTAEQLIAYLAARRVPYPIHPLAGPVETPPPGQVGYGSDGARHVIFAVVSRLRRRLFVEAEADGTIHTNILGYVFEETVDSAG